MTSMSDTTTRQTAPTTWKLLYLGTDPHLVRRQLAGEHLLRADAGPLRDDVSTDEITPVAILGHYDARLGDFAHTGLRCGTDNPVGTGDLRRAQCAVLVAGRRYGKGSSREHSPTAELLSGVRLVIAESFERIHRSNLVGMGVIPFEFMPGEDRKTLGLKGTETVDIEGLGNDIRPLSAVPCRITYADGAVKTIQIKCRIDTEIEVDYVKHGGVLHYVLRDLARSGA
jgi:3-isopropylmalate dehydratase small subunit